MSTVLELLGFSGREFAAQPEGDALTEQDALQEADLRGARYDMVERSLMVLFDLRNALQFRISDAGVLVVRDVLEVRVVEPWVRPGKWFSRYVIGSIPDTRGDTFVPHICCADGYDLAVSGLTAEFFVGNIPGLPAAPPDFLNEDESAIADGMPAWTSEFEPGWATFADPAARRWPGSPASG